MMGACCAASVHAQEKQAPLSAGYPSKPIRAIVGSSPGGGSDIVTRALAQKLSEKVGRPVIVDNRAGGSGVIAMNIVAQSAPDGYTLMSAGNLLVLNGVLKRVAYDIRRTFDPVAQMTSQPYMLVVNPGVPVRSLKELIAYAKSKPRTLSYGSSGVGSVNHLGTELFKSMAGIDLVHVPYKGNAPVLVDLISGQIHVAFATALSSGAHVRSGKLTAVAAADVKRMQALPHLPTMSEAGLPGFVLTNSYGLFAPGGTPRHIMRMLNQDVGQIMNSPDMKERLVADGADPAPILSLEATRERFLNEIARWQKFIDASGFKVAE
jgi:tripartite-type tricarboxylate transporter receptor subunit TctC